MVILRKGQSLYTGSVDGMNASHGFVILQSGDNEKLHATLEAMQTFSHIKREGDTLIAYLNEPMDAATLNRELFEKGIVLSRLEKRKESLEEQFLQLTNNN